MTLRILLALAIAVLVQCSRAAGESDALSDAWTATKQEAKRLAVIGQIRATLIDRKDVKSRYVRVRFDGKNLQLAGFVQSTNMIAIIEQAAREVAKPERVETFWAIQDNLQDHDPYKTFVEEQTSDFGIWLKVKASLASPDVRPLLKNAVVQAVDVDHGKVTLYLIVDAPPAEIDLAPHIKGISGVKGYECRLAKTYAAP